MTMPPARLCGSGRTYEQILAGRMGSNIHFVSCCNGNLNAISKLPEGQEATQANRILKGKDCGGRGTSCADQLVRAVEAALQQEQIK